MRYLIFGEWNHRTVRDHITEEEFEAARRFGHILFHANETEEAFNLLIENWLDLETALFSITLSRAVRHQFGWTDGADMRVVANQKLVSLLTTAKLYIDQTQRVLSEVCGKESAELEAFRTELNRQYDAREGYRFLEALRNHVVHYGLPVHSLTLEASREPVEGAQLDHSISLYVKIDRLVENEAFKRTVVRAYVGRVDRVELNAFVKDYLTGLTAAHITGRSLLKDWVDKAEADFERRAFGLSDGGARNINHLTLRAIDDETSEVVEEVQIGRFVNDRRRELAKRNNFKAEFSRINVSI